VGGDNCDLVQSCCDSTQCWYNADGTKFSCNGHDCYSAAQKVVSHCAPAGSSGSSSSDDSDDTDESSGCAISGAHGSRPNAGWLAALGAMVSLSWLRRRQRNVS
jgi:hypothetical protein